MAGNISITPSLDYSISYSFLVELLELVVRARFRVHEVPIVYTERRAGKSKMSRGVIAESVIRPWFLLARRLTEKR